jgi:hypothetical protein
MEDTSKITELTAFINHQLEDNIHLVVVRDMVLTKAHYEELFDVQMKLSRNEKIGIIVDPRSVKMLTREAGMYLRDKMPDIMWGIVVMPKTEIARMVITFFIKVMKPNFPIKSSADINSAKKWLKDMTTDKQISTS